ncbi:MAG: NADH-quinone oxidoreductase subunit I [Candidatus Eisenbacteria bacterium]|nr:NADH-quinone oxidoreductase subunit I [Candidatus Eisenbacteria bacterium]
MVPAVAAAVNAAPRRSRAREYLANIWRAVTSTFEGLSVTMSWMFRRPATIQYPDKVEKPVQEMLPPGYRGVLEVDLQRCIGCLLCQRTCPIGCIQIKVEKNAETGVREITQFDIDMGRCMYCGLCSEAEDCDAIMHTTQFEATVPHPDLLVLHFVKEPVPVAKRATAPPRRPLGSILDEVLAEFGRRSRGHRWQGMKPAADASQPDDANRSTTTDANAQAAEPAPAQNAAAESPSQPSASEPAKEERDNG